MRTAVGWLVALVVVPGAVTGAEGVDYLRDVKPLLSRRCVACHGALTQKSGLRLDTGAAILKGGEGGPAVVAGKAGESLIVEAVAGNDGWRMPPKGEGEPLSAAEVATISSWINQGARFPDEPEPPDPRRHWAFQPPVRPDVPRVRDVAWSRNPIDAFLSAEHERRGIVPLPLADKEVLVRRVALDLTGLAPTPEEVRAFLADPAVDAYERLVDRLLASPQYGERWGRHWMDVWRYSDWDGYGAEVRESQPHLWRWRDWIVESLNRDDGYDRMVVAMLAADEATPGDRDALRATGYLVRNWYKFNRNVWLENTVEHTAKAFLGITLNCARCHDHKYDPIAQEDYYRFRAFFEPHQVRTDRVPGHPDPAQAGLVRVYDADLKAPTFLFRRGDEKHPAKDRPLGPGLPRVLAPKELEIAAVSLRPDEFHTGLIPFIRQEDLARAVAEVANKQASFEAARNALAAIKTSGEGARKAIAAVALAERGLDAARAGRMALEVKMAADDARYADPPRPDADRLAVAAGRAERRAALAAAEFALVGAEQAHDAATEAQKPGDAKGKAAPAAAAKKRDEARKAVEAARSALANETPSYSPIAPIYPPTSSGRRLALARWIASRSNPLAARVAVNHVWMRHFGSPLVATVFDLGLNGRAPANPALLDWLAVEFMDRGWRMKELHRLIVTSRAYRATSGEADASDSNRAIDPENRTLWRMNARRMEAELVRDNLLHASGMLDTTLGGPDLDPNEGQASRRRSLYFRHAKEKRVTFLKLFDSANATACYRRTESVVPQQALALANSPIAREQSRRLAAALSKPDGPEPSPGTNPAFIGSAFEHILGRAPTPEERDLCATYLVDQARRFASPGLTPFPSGPAAPVKPAANPVQRAREDLVHVLFNHNDFVTIR